MRRLSDVEVGWAVQLACLYEVGVVKPGNVTPWHAFDDTCHEDFVASAAAIGPVFRRAGHLSVGEAILRAVTATSQSVTSNTNLGIVLLLAPLACAAARASSTQGGLRDAVETVLAGLTVEDARAAYRAIRLASPAAIGVVESCDVSDEEVDVTLREAMTAAAGRDSVASEYATGYGITFAVGLPALRAALEGGAGFAEAVMTAFLRILALVPDTLIARKRGRETARWASGRADDVLVAGGPSCPDGRRELELFDRELRDGAHALNPGTTADLVCASIFAMLVEDAVRVPCRTPAGAR
ncbi:MAG: triphosphoribosyl-dephospho-CoA synthase [Actinobacteria bacterium]|nr:triphosphoribosyl-dephospho-CoA synthase [Actinomycetota bacterium]